MSTETFNHDILDHDIVWTDRDILAQTRVIADVIFEFAPQTAGISYFQVQCILTRCGYYGRLGSDMPTGRNYTMYHADALGQIPSRVRPMGIAGVEVNSMLRVDRALPRRQAMAYVVLIT